MGGMLETNGRYKVMDTIKLTIYIKYQEPITVDAGNTTVDTTIYM